MRLSWLVLCALVLGLGSRSPARAQPVGTTRVAIVDTDVLFSATGVARYRAALARLDAEKATFVAVENPSADAPPKVDAEALGFSPKHAAALEKQLREIQRRAAPARAWEAHVDSVLEPIRADVRRELAAYARRHGIGLVLDAAEIGGGLVVAPGVDVTAAFIKHYDARAAKRPVTKPRR